MTGVAMFAVSAVAFVLGVVLAGIGRAAFEEGTSTRIAGPLRTAPDPWVQAAGLGLFGFGVLLMAAALSAVGWLT